MAAPHNRSLRGEFVLRLGRLLLIISGLCCGMRSSPAQTSDSTATDQSNKSWTSVTDLKSDGLLPTSLPVRIIKRQSRTGNRTFENRIVEVQGVDGRLVPYQEIEIETLQVDTGTARSTTRTFGQDVNGQRSLIQLTEETKHTSPNGDSRVVRLTSDPDVNGNLQPVQREVIETRAIGKDVEQTDTTVMLPNINGGLAPAFKTRELQTRRGDGATESKKTTLLADGAGNWQVSEIRQVRIVQEGVNRTTEERVSRRDAEGRLGDVSENVLREQSDRDGGGKHTTVETYSIDVPGMPRDGHLHMVERTTIFSQSNPSGGQRTEKTVEQPNPGDPQAGLRVSILVDNKMVPGPAGEQSTVTIQARDSNNSFPAVAVDTTTPHSTSTAQPPQIPRRADE